MVWQRQNRKARPKGFLRMKSCFLPADILLPDFSRTDGYRWAVIACDQFTSRPEYWEKAREIAGDSPSALDLIFPEAYLGREEEFLPRIACSMGECVRRGILCEYPNVMIYLERIQSDGRLRRGIIGAVDLECYDWHPESQTLIRATEGTVPERIPPRVRIRQSASLELPHVMLLVDDHERRIIEYFSGRKNELTPAYDFDLMLGGGHVSAWFIEKEEDISHVTEAIEKLSAPDAALTKYGIARKAPLAIAVGDGNHSLATAKAVYENLKAEIGEEAAREHPARYALAELVNIHDDALEFEPIYRVVFGADAQKLLASLKEYAAGLHGSAAPQSIRAIYGDREETIEIPTPEHQLAVGSLQRFLDGYLADHPGAVVDYIHGVQECEELGRRAGNIAFLFDGMRKDDLFRSVICDGPLPRKTFSMGHAEDKRYYIEARRITK